MNSVKETWTLGVEPEVQDVMFGSMMSRYKVVEPNDWLPYLKHGSSARFLYTDWTRTRCT
jgi:hypothetical protein